MGAVKETNEKPFLEFDEFWKKACISMRHTPWLFIKYYWYKYIRRKNIIGFFAGVPVIVTDFLEEEENVGPNSP